MQYYFAPMEGITGYIYRNVHHRFFPGNKEDHDPKGASGYPAGE